MNRDDLDRLAGLLSRAHIAVYVRMFTDAAGYTDHEAGGQLYRANPEVKPQGEAYYVAVARELVAAGVRIVAATTVDEATVAKKLKQLLRKTEIEPLPAVPAQAPTVPAATSLNLDAVVAGYIAGFVDGEGCISITNGSCLKPRLRIAVASSNEAICQWLLKVTGLGAVCCQSLKKRRRLDIWQWRVHGSGVLVILNSISPYLIVKQEQARVCMEYGRLRDSLSVPLAVAYKDKVESLNSRRRHAALFPTSENGPVTPALPAPAAEGLFA